MFAGQLAESLKKEVKSQRSITLELKQAQDKARSLAKENEIWRSQVTKMQQVHMPDLQVRPRTHHVPVNFT